MQRREFILAVGGAAASWSSAAYAQPIGKTYRIGYLALLPGEEATLLKPFSQRLQELGYSERNNITLEYRSAEGHPERLAQLAAELAHANPDVLVAGMGTLAAKAVAAASTTIPVVFTNVGDPVGAKLITSLARPGANVTGVSAQANEIAAKRLQILGDLFPGEQRIAVLLNPDTPYSASALREVRSAAEQRHRPLQVLEARTTDELWAGIEAAVKTGAAGLIALEDPLILSAKGKIVELAAAARLPTMFGLREFTEAGGLMSYGPDLRQNSRRAADYVDKVLKGIRPADLPVEQPTKFEFVINLKTAKALGLALPPMLVGLADEVIE
jgi:putative ABC transport system substrate-binding protein